MGSKIKVYKIKSLVNSKNLFLLFSVALIIIYRVSWVPIAHWGVDAAANLWIGYVYDIPDLKIGLISSQFIPNPNGMMILGKLLSLLGSTRSISIFLTLLNLFIVFLILQNLFPDKNIDFYMLLFLLGSSVLISSTVVEFWNQWLLLTINLSLINCLIGYLRHRKPKNLYVCIFLIPLPSFIYLGGLTSSLVFALILSCFIFSEYRTSFKNLLLFSTFGAVTLFIYWRITFSSFFIQVPFQRLSELNTLSIYDRLKYLMNNILNLPDALLNIWSTKDKLVILRIDPPVLEKLTTQLIEIFYQFHKIIPLFVIGVFLIGVLSYLLNGLKLDNSILNKSLALVISFISLSLVLSPIYGGPDYLIIQERDDNLNQFYPFYILMWYLLPMLFSKMNYYKFVNPISKIVFTIFIILNTLTGIYIVKDNIEFQETLNTNVEAPLSDNIDVVNFIASEWLSTSGKKELFVEYKVFVKDMSWVNKYTNELGKYYKPSPYTEGRLLDYELLKVHELTNIKNSGEPDFIVTNIFDPPPKFKERVPKHTLIGRLRVSQ